MRRYTKFGRVVYDRPRHRWTLRDLLRVGENFGAFIFELSREAFEATAIGLLNTAEAEESFSEFSGGSFGGAGATRSFGEGIVAPVDASGLRVKRVIIMVETFEEDV